MGIPSCLSPREIMTEPSLDAAALWVPIETLEPWPGNPRVNESAVADVAESIRRFGFASPIIAREEDRQVIAGHTRLKAARLLGLDRVPVRLLDIDPADARLLALADNKLGEIASWDDALLSDVLRELEAEGVALEGIGWSDDELAELLAMPDPDPEPPTEPEDDTLPEAPPALTQPGEVITIGRHTLHCGDCLEVMRALPDCSVDSIVTDPPYGLGFMGKTWDVSVPGLEWAEECLRVLKPGGHLVAFGGTRTVHRLTCALEDAGLEIRDCGVWIYWQGFPKSQNAAIAIDKKLGAMEPRGVAVKHHRGQEDFARPQGMPQHVAITPEAKRWQGFGTGLKPSQEPWVLARKPLEGTLAENLLKWGCGGLNIDGCRIAPGDVAWPGPGGGDLARTNSTPDAYSPTSYTLAPKERTTFDRSERAGGRWPANLYHCPKPSRGEREEGCEDLGPITGADAVERKEGSAGLNSPGAGSGRTASEVRNHHPTVKPARLFRWLSRLVTPPGGVLLEPFAGSGTTLIAAEREGFRAIGIEREPGYCDISRARLSAVVNGDE